MSCFNCKGSGLITYKGYGGIENTVPCRSCEGGGGANSKSSQTADSSASTAVASNAPAGAEFRKIDSPQSENLKKIFRKMLMDFGEAENVGLDVMMALCLDAILLIHINTSGPQYTDDKLLLYMANVTGQYRAAFKAKQN